MPRVSLEEALYEIGRWINSTGHVIGERIRGLLIQATALFLFGRIQEAIEHLERALNMLGDQETNPSQKARILDNLAYYFASLVHSSAGAKCEAESRAQDYLRQAKDVVLHIAQVEDKQRMNARITDTDGYVRIMLGATETDIREGLQLCESAKQDSLELNAADLYYQVHERIAWQRILRIRR